MELDSKSPSVSNLNIGNGLSLLASLSAHSAVSTSNSINATISSVISNSTGIPYHYNPNNNNIPGPPGGVPGLGPSPGYHHINSHYNTSGGEIKMGGEEAPSMHQSEGGGKTDMEHLRPDMVPITVRSDLPQLKDITIEKVLCGTNLTWDEFLHLFHVTLDPNLHIVKGSGGRKANLLDKVGDYVKILKRRMKVYLVNIELIHPAKKLSKSSNSSVTSSSNTPATNNATPSSTSGKRSKSNGNAAAKEQNRDNTPSKRKSKKPKWVDTREGLPKSSQELIENPEKSLSMETQVFSNSNTSTGLPKPAKAERKKRVRKKNNASNNNGHLGGALSGISAPSHAVEGFLQNLTQMQMHSNEALNLVSTSQSPPSKLRSSLEGSCYLGLPNNPNELPMFPLNFSNNNGSHQINEHDLTSASSNGGDDDDTTLDSKSESMLGFGEFDIKPAVVQFLVHKISNKNMLRIREELLNLKNSDDYFKLTCVAPLAAGLLEQMFCRNSPKQEST